jgi:uncharacterized protein YndB with AHSA1/START domain
MEGLMSQVEPIVVEQTFNAPVDRVWRAITDKDEMRQWFFESIAEFSPEIGFETAFNVRSGERDYLHLWKVTTVIPEKKVVYDWKYSGIPGASFVAWELLPTGSGTTLRLTHTGIETFPEDDAAFSRESCQAGWKYFLCERLNAYLQKTV